MVALSVGADIPGADLIKAMGRSAKPAAVYRAYIKVPIVISSPRANVKALSPSRRLLAMSVSCFGGLLTILVLKYMLEEIQIIMSALTILCNGYKKADEEEYDHEEDESYCVLEGPPEFGPKGLGTFLGCNLIIFFVPKIGKGHHDQTEQSV